MHLQYNVCSVCSYVNIVQFTWVVLLGYCITLLYVILPSCDSRVLLGVSRRTVYFDDVGAAGYQERDRGQGSAFRPGNRYHVDVAGI